MSKRLPFGELKVTSVRVCEISPEPLNRPDLVHELWNKNVPLSSWYDHDKECLVVFALDTRLKCKGFFLISLGSLNETIANPREIFKPLIAVSAYSFVICHNHPTGDPSPSEADRRMTRRVHECGELLGIPLMDHIIIGNETNRFSFRKCGLI